MKAERIITYENLRNFAYSNDKICKEPIQGIVLRFPGLNFSSMQWEDDETSRFFADRGIIYLLPYVNPWAWMNTQTVAFTDELLEAIRTEYRLPNDIPVVSSGGSMGGQQALVYAVYAQYTPVSCVVNCPVCDLAYHYSERSDLPRTMYSAFGGDSRPLQDAIRAASPMHLADQLPDIAYFVFHCEADTAVNIQAHSEKFVALLKARHRVVYHTVPDRGHCDLPKEDAELYQNYIIKSILENHA